MSLKSKPHDPVPVLDPESEDSIYNKSTPTYDISEAETQMIDFEVEDGYIQNSPAARTYNEPVVHQTRGEHLDITEVETQIQLYNVHNSEEDSISTVPTPPVDVHLIMVSADSGDKSDMGSSIQSLVVNQNPTQETFVISNLETQPNFLDSDDLDIQDKDSVHEVRINSSDVHDLETQPIAIDRDPIEESIKISYLETRAQFRNSDSSDSSIRNRTKDWDRTKNDTVGIFASRLSTDEVESNDESHMGSQTQPFVDISYMETQPQFLDSKSPDMGAYHPEEDSKDSDFSATQRLVVPTDTDGDQDACSQTQLLVIDPEDSGESVMSATQPLVIPLCVDINSSNDDDPLEAKSAVVPVDQVDDDSQTQAFYPGHFHAEDKVLENKSRSNESSSAAQTDAKQLFGTKRYSVLKRKVSCEQLEAEDSDQEGIEDEDITPPVSLLLDTSDVARTPPVSPVLVPSDDEESTPPVSPNLDAWNIRNRATPLQSDLIDTSDSIIEPTPRLIAAKTNSTSIQQSRSHSPDIFTVSRHPPVSGKILPIPELEVKSESRSRRRRDTDASTVMMEDDRHSVHSCQSPVMFEDDDDSSAIPETQSPVFSYPCVDEGSPSKGIIDETRRIDDESDIEEDDNHQANCSPPKKRKVVRRSDLNDAETSAVIVPLRTTLKQRTSTPDNVLINEANDTSDVDMGDSDFEITFASHSPKILSPPSPASVSSARAISRASLVVQENQQPSPESPILRRKARHQLPSVPSTNEPIEQKETVGISHQDELKENIIVEENAKVVQEVYSITRRSNRRSVANLQRDPCLYELGSKKSEIITEEVEIQKKRRTRGGRKKTKEEKVDASVSTPPTRGRTRTNVEEDISYNKESIALPVVLLKSSTECYIDSSELKPRSHKKPMMEDVPKFKDPVPSAPPITDHPERNSCALSSNSSAFLEAGPSFKRPTMTVQEDPFIIKADNYKDLLHDQSQAIANGDDDVSAHKTRLRAAVDDETSRADPKSQPSFPGNKLVGEVDEKEPSRSKTDASEGNIDRLHDTTTLESSGAVPKVRRGRPRKIQSKNVKDEKSVSLQLAPSTDTSVSDKTAAAQVLNSPTVRTRRKTRSNKESNKNDTKMDASYINELADAKETSSRPPLPRGQTNRKNLIPELESEVKIKSSACAAPRLSRRKCGAQTSNETETVDANNKSIIEASPALRRLNRTRSTSTDCNQNEEHSRRRTRRALVKPVKIMFTGSGISDDENLHDIVIFLGGEIVDRPTECSILVTDKIRRTVKFLCTVGLGLPIVSPDWLEKSKVNGRFLNPWDHLLRDPEGEDKWNFNLSDSLKEASQQSMLGEYVFTVSSNVRPEPSEMADIISSCKGRCIKEFIGDPAPGEKRIAISTEISQDKRRWIAWTGLKAVIVKAEAILSGVLRQKFEPGNFRLG